MNYFLNFISKSDIMSVALLKKSNMFNLLSYDSEDDLYEYEKVAKKVEEEKIIQRDEKRLQKEEIMRKNIELQKQKEANMYALSLKRTKIWHKDPLYSRFDYIKLVKEDNYDIASYLSLSSQIQRSLDISNMGCALTYGFVIFNKDEYLYLVKIMEQAKNPEYYDPTKQLENMMSISETRLMKCYFSGIHKSIGYEFASIYHIYKFLLWDTPNYRRLLKDSRYRSLKVVIEKDLKEFIENPYQMHNKIEQEYVSKYFEIGKRYYAKRNNFKILFRNYIRFIGKIMIMYRKISD